MPELLYAGVITAPVQHHPWHRHNHWELVCYTAGAGVTTVGDSAIPFRIGTIIALPPELPHQEDATTPTYANIHLGVRGGLGRGIPCCQDDDAGSFRTIGEALVREARDRLPGWESTAAALLNVLLLWLRRWSGPADTLMTRADRLLRARLADPDLRVDAVARELGVSDDTLRRRFVALHGEPPRRRLLRLRLDESRLALARGASVAAAATAAGFSDPFHFSRSFRAAFGHPPSAERTSP